MDADGITGVSHSQPISITLTRERILKAQDEEAKMGYTPWPRICLLGGVAAVCVSLLPLLLLLLNVLVALLSGVTGAGLGQTLLPILVHPAFITWTFFCITLGISSAFARRWSIRNGRFWWINVGSGMRLGLDDLLSIFIGPIYLALALSVSGAGPLFWYLLAASPLPAYTLHALWEFAYAPLVRRFGQVTDLARIDVVVTMLRTHLTRYCQNTTYHYDSHNHVLEIQVYADSDKAVEMVQNICKQVNLHQLAIETIRVTRKPTQTNADTHI